MKILVCVKQVPDTESAFRPNASETGYDESGLVFRMNEYDEYAVEEAVRIKEKFRDVEITALSVGPDRAEAIVRRGLEFGADHGVHIVTPAECRMDALEVASLIARFAQDKSFDLLFFGIMSEDYQRCQTGPMVAALLDLPCTTTVISQNISEDRKSAVVERELERGRREVVELPLPGVMTVQSGINMPRYPNLTNKLRARKQEIEVIAASETPSSEKCERLVRAYIPPPSKAGIFIEGTVEEQAEKIVRIIHEKTDIL